MNPVPADPLHRCPRCQAVLIGSSAGLVSMGKCPFCLPKPDTEKSFPAAVPPDPGRN